MRTPAPQAPSVPSSADQGVQSDEAREATAPRQAPIVSVALYFGCRGSADQAEILDAAEGEDLLEESVPENACLKGLDAELPTPPPNYADCTGLGVGSDSYQTESWQQRQEEIAETERSYREELLPAHEARLKRLRELYPRGPLLCVSVSNPGPLALERLRVQHYARPASKVEHCVDVGEEPFIRKSGNDGLRVGEVIIPSLGPGEVSTACVEAWRYEDMLHGAVLAADMAEAEAFIRQLTQARDEAQLELEGASERVKVLSARLPHAQVSTEFKQSCNNACY